MPENEKHVTCPYHIFYYTEFHTQFENTRKHFWVGGGVFWDNVMLELEHKETFLGGGGILG